VCIFHESLHGSEELRIRGGIVPRAPILNELYGRSSMLPHRLAALAILTGGITQATFEVVARGPRLVESMVEEVVGQQLEKGR
jgi:hypothetical protein